MKQIKNIKVYLRFGEEESLVGELVHNHEDIYFKYSSSFLDAGLEISPYKLPLQKNIFKSPGTPFEGLFGVFDDSLPDGWGRLLLDRKLIQQGINPQEVSPLSRLALIGNQGSGALVYKPISKLNTPISLPLELDKIAIDSKNVLAGTSEEILDELYGLGGSSGGARPKILVGYNHGNNHIIPDKISLPEEYEHWIIKFASSRDLPDIAEVEYAYYLMAKSAGIEMAESKLLNGKSGKKYFATKRFDRVKNKRLHLHSAAGLVHDNYRLSSLDYGHLMDAAFSLERSVRAYEKVLRLATFNIYTHNRDDHSKNFSFLMDERGSWRLAPAYDLTFSSSSHGMHSTTVAGEGKNPGTEHIKALANEFGVKNVSKIIEEVKTVSSQWESFAKKASVTSQTTKMIKNSLEKVSKK